MTITFNLLFLFFSFSIIIQGNVGLYSNEHGDLDNTIHCSNDDIMQLCCHTPLPMRYDVNSPLKQEKKVRFEDHIDVCPLDKTQFGEKTRSLGNVNALDQYLGLVY